MGDKYLIQGGHKTKMSQIKIEKYTILGEGNQVTQEEVRKIGDSLGIDWTRISLQQLVEGTGDEFNEHTDICGSDVSKAVRIAYAHLREIPDYYTRLKAMERDAENKDLMNNVQNS